MDRPTNLMVRCEAALGRARRGTIHTDDDDVLSLTHDDLHCPCAHARLTRNPWGMAKGPDPSLRSTRRRHCEGDAAADKETAAIQRSVLVDMVGTLVPLRG